MHLFRLFFFSFFVHTLIGHDLFDIRRNEWLVKKFSLKRTVTFTSLKFKFHKNHQLYQMITSGMYELELYIKWGNVYSQNLTHIYDFYIC